METDSPVVYHGTSESRFPTKETQKSQAQLSPDEIRVLRECNKESFYYRCLPFALAGMTATYLAVRKGFLAPHPKWGPGLKMTGAAFVGWILGKFSYRSICEDKFLRLEKSAVGDIIRKKRGYTSETFQDEFASVRYTDEQLSSTNDNFSSFSGDDYHSSSGSLNLDVDKNVQYSGLDDRERPSTDRENQNFIEDSEPGRRFTSYEELRKRNRDEYEKQQTQPQVPKSNLSQSGATWSFYDTGPPKKYSTDPNESTSKNIYGDSWGNSKFS